jgi:hypothetical protein
VILIPALLTGGGGFLFMLWGAWYTGVALHSPFSVHWLKEVFGAPVPLWMFAVAVAISAFSSRAWWMTWRKFRKPLLHVSIAPNSCCWDFLPSGKKGAMDIRATGWFTITNTDRAVKLVCAYLEGAKPSSHFVHPIILDPYVSSEKEIKALLYTALANECEDVSARLCFEDALGNVYKTDIVTFTAYYQIMPYQFPSQSCKAVARCACW